MVGIPYKEKHNSDKYPQTTYAYSYSDLMPVDPEAQSGKKYTNLLFKCGYKYEGIVVISGVNYHSFYHADSGTRVRYGMVNEIQCLVVVVAYA